ncbi:HD domain-containing protein [Candidatus Desantisbacteria bacterium]|nr:HD domain-containing protein [Candidatus Desantisbacteria bacterium]
MINKTRNIICTIITSIIITGLIAIIIAIETLLGNLPIQQLVLPVFITSLGIAIYFPSLRKQVERYVDKVFLKKAYKQELAINRFSITAISTLNKEVLCYALKQTLSNISITNKITVFLMDTEQQKYLAMVDRDIAKETTNHSELDTNHPIVQKIAVTKGVLRRGDMLEIEEWFEDREIELLFPLFHNHDLLGVIGIDEKPNKKPYSSHEINLLHILTVNASLALANINLYEEQTSSLEHGIFALLKAIEAKDTYTCGHCERVARIASALAINLDLSEAEVEDIKTAGLLHDIGKIGISRQILNKPDRLLSEEFQQIKKHPKIGATIIESIAFSREITDAVYSHHERYDGKGYPEGISNKEISLFARILHVADAYEAMTSNRSYRKAMEKNEANAQLLINSGTQFDPEIVKKFLEIVENVENIE